MGSRPEPIVHDGDLNGPERSPLVGATAAAMEEHRRRAELAGPLELLPAVDFCCVYGSSLLRNNSDKTSMVDYILGVADPIQWHSEASASFLDGLLSESAMNLTYMIVIGTNHRIWKGTGTTTRNGWGGSARRRALGFCYLFAQINWVAYGIGVGVHFNPFVEWKDKMIKYGVVQMHDLAMDVLTWDRFYLSGRLQKPVQVLIDNWDIQKVNLINLKAATSASLLLLPAKFSEEDLYAKICSLSYMGDLRMLFAEDKNKVKNIVRGSFTSFQSMYKPSLQEFAAEGLLQIPSAGHEFEQDCGLSATRNHFFSLPWTIQRRLGMKHEIDGSGITKPQTIITSRELAANRVTRSLRRLVMISSARQAMSGLAATGGVAAARYLARKISKAWKSRTS
ncbi:hypothetical protein C4D60_Mb01t25010 [Musa balbisiana]|uniref:Phosphatidate cytidylyltransferase, mitochondrial n=1 Tax=Musa balbisiana TaxID=52838 RepID=A0A4S8JPY0_MUSBA|nr:hypothetical protein C4D60_Mb01t25010 [Musa balbisiana]